MKILLFTLWGLFLLGSFLSLTIFLWDNTKSTIGKGLFISGDLFCIYYVYFILNSYAKVTQEKNIIVVSKLFSRSTYDLNKLQYWHDSLNVYRVRVRKLNLGFENKNIKLVDTYDRNVESLYHYLRTHYAAREKNG